MRAKRVPREETLSLRSYIMVCGGPEEHVMKRALYLAAALAALIPTSAVADRPCLQFGWIYNWKPVTDKILMVEDYNHRKFRLSLIGTCYNLYYYQKLGFKSR